MTRAETQTAPRQFKTVFSRGSEDDSVAEFFNKLGTRTIFPQATLGLISLLADNKIESISFMITAFGTGIGLEASHRVYRKLHTK